MKKKIRLQPGLMRAAFQPKSYDEKRNTMEVVWTTGARVKRSSFWDGDFYEELSLDKGAVNLERMNAGAPLLNNHGTWGGGLRDIIGVVVQGSARIENGKGHATVQFSGRSDVKEIIDDIKAGIIPNLSVGYRVDKFVEQDEEAEDGLPILRAESWEPMEISFVTVPADPGAQSRSQNQTREETHEVIVQRKEGGTTMAKKKKPSVVAKRSPGHPVHTEGDAHTADSKGSKSAKGADASDEITDDQNVDAEDEVSGEEPALEAADLGEEHAEHEGEHTEDEEFDADEGDEEVVDEEAEEAEEADEELEEKPAAKPAAKKASAKKKSGKRAAKVSSTEETRQAEIQRGEEIRKQVRLANLPETFADDLVRDAKISVADAGQRIFAEMEKRSSNKTINNRVEVKGMEQRLLRRQAAVRGLLHRVDAEKYKLKQDGDQEFRHDSLIDLARSVLHAEGVSGVMGMSRTQIAERALHTTSDFSAILSDAANVTLREGYDSVPSTYEEFTKKKNVSDFRDISSVEISNGGKLEKVNEHGEYRRTSLVEGAEKYRLTKFGIVIGRTFELIVNDKIGALTDIPRKLGVRAREKENEVFWSLILSNPVMSDGYNFFSAQHGNLGTGGVMSDTTFGEARAKMRVQRDLDGELISGLAPEWLVTPAQLETGAEKILSPLIIPGTVADLNPFRNKLKPMVEPRLDANSLTAYYLFASKAKRAIAEMSLLDGRGPEIFTREGFDIDGQETKVRYIFGMGLIDWRGAFKNAGA